MNKNNIIGKIYSSNNFGKFKVLGKIQSVFNEYDKGECRYKIQFENTGYITYPLLSAITHGRVKDKLVPTVANIGYIGSDIIISQLPYFPLYKTWNDMMNRCYNSNDEDYMFYGGIGISVDKSWWNFTQFYNDAIHLPGYDLKLMYPNDFQLDKDYLQFNIEKSKRVYSKYTCIWISKGDNFIIAQRELGTKSGYYGVIYKDGAYCCRINGIIYGRFTIPEAAANLFNYIYPIIMAGYTSNLIKNDVRLIPIKELPKYVIPKFATSSKYYNIGSTTNPEMGVESK